MDDRSESRDYDELSDQEQADYCRVSLNLVMHVKRYAIPIIFAPPPSMGGKINGATGCMLRLGSQPFLITASHVLAKYEERVRQGEVLNWQVGELCPFDPISRVAWRREKADIVLLEMSELEASSFGNSSSLVFSAATGWPPSAPTIGQVVLVAGYPAVLRDVSSANIEAGAYSAMFRVDTANEGFFYCKIEQQELISFDGGSLPPPNSEIGGLSGGPVCLMTNLAYPLIGIVTEHVSAYDILRIATLDCVIESDIRREL